MVEANEIVKLPIITYHFSYDESKKIASLVEYQHICEWVCRSLF